VTCSTPLSTLVAFLWPGRCSLCDGELPVRALVSVCPACWTRLPLSNEPRCPRCDLPGWARRAPCPDCGGWPPGGALERIVAPFVYREAMRVLHRRLKFGGELDLCGPLGKRMALAWSVRGPWLPDLIVPVPPDSMRYGPRRSVVRRLAREVAGTLGVPFLGRGVRKRRHTPSLSRLGGQSRRKALEGAFHWESREALRNRHVLLIDDVATTGSTLTAMAQAAAAAGADRVAGLVLARTPVESSLGARP